MAKAAVQQPFADSRRKTGNQIWSIFEQEGRFVWWRGGVRERGYEGGKR